MHENFRTLLGLHHGPASMQTQVPFRTHTFIWTRIERIMGSI